MGVIIWYKAAFQQPGLPGPLVVSNDVYSGRYIVDGDITLKMFAGETIDTFELKWVNLLEDIPMLLASLLKERSLVKQGPPLLVEIHLGYFDDFTRFSRSNAVMVGAVTSVQYGSNDNGDLETTVKGQEIAGYRLSVSDKSYSNQGEIDLDSLVAEIAKDAGVPVAQGFVPLGRVSDFTLKKGNGLAALSEVAKVANVPLIVGNGQIAIGKLVEGWQPPINFDPLLNLARQVEELAIEDGKCTSTLTLTVLGDPSLRVGQRAVVVQGEQSAPIPRPITELTHSFSAQNGYSCEVILKEESGPTEDAQQEENGPKLTGADGVVQALLATVDKMQKPALDVGEVRIYEATKHMATLKYGQTPASNDVAPSVEGRVNEDTTLFSKPLASAFAWDRCGLIVPVYPGMRALLGHNQGQINDAVIAGFLWSEEPGQEYRRPSNEPGDYWLCLPTDVLENERPVGKGVNDLTDRRGMRLIQTKGLHIFVGDAALPEVGERPINVPEEQEVVIEHEMGARIRLGSAGEVEISNGPGLIRMGKDGSVEINATRISLSSDSTVSIKAPQVEIS